MKPLIPHTRFILINTSHAGNVGATARAMKVMGFGDLVLVAPRWANVLRREETIQRASGALDVLSNARIVSTLDEALDGMTHLCATAMTPRDFGPPTHTPRTYFETLSKKELKENNEDKVPPDNLTCEFVAQAGCFPPEGMAFLFGSERFGMRNEDVYRCNVALSIPTNPKFGSLNLAAAVQLIAYEWRLALGGRYEEGVPDSVAAGVPLNNVQEATHSPVPGTDNLADARQVAGMLAHWEQSLVDIDFLDPAAPKKLMPRLNQLFNRAALTQEEIHILRGIAKAMSEAAAGKRESPADSCTKR